MNKPSTTRFNFHNDPTYHWYVFVRSGLAGDVNKLVVDAMSSAGEHGLDEFDDKLGVCHKVRSHLGSMLGELFDELTGAGLHSGEWVETAEGEGRIFVRPEIGEVDPSRNDVKANLIRPLLAWAAEQISHETVAEAILRDEGKWNPVRRTPKRS